jgi:dihydropteroate synthase
MGILNVTPDSFSDGGKFNSVDAAVARAGEMLQEGADIIDIGGESTRPGAEDVSEAEELKRVIPVIKAIREKLGNAFPVSIDTYKSAVAREALAAGASMINALGGFCFDEALADVAAEYDCPYVIYHIKGMPRTMQTGEIAYHEIISDISQFFEDQIVVGIGHGMKREQFIIDPGIGFGKTVEQNLEIIKRLSEFSTLNLPILVGVSRKSHLGKILQQKLHLTEMPAADDRLEASLAETAVAVKNGAKIIRTHDVKETKRFLTTLEAL